MTAKMTPDIEGQPHPRGAKRREVGFRGGITLHGITFAVTFTINGYRGKIS